MSNPLMSSSPKEMLDLYFLETRAKLLEIAANLDRFDRAAGRTLTPGDDPRVAFVHEALKILQSAAPNRAELLQQLYSRR